MAEEFKEKSTATENSEDTKAKVLFTGEVCPTCSQESVGQRAMGLLDGCIVVSCPGMRDVLKGVRAAGLHPAHPQVSDPRDEGPCVGTIWPLPISPLALDMHCTLRLPSMTPKASLMTSAVNHLSGRLPVLSLRYRPSQATPGPTDGVWSYPGCTIRFILPSCPGSQTTRGGRWPLAESTQACSPLACLHRPALSERIPRV